MVFAYAMMDHGGKIKESKEEKLRRLCKAWTQEVGFFEGLGRVIITKDTLFSQFRKTMQYCSWLKSTVPRIGL